MSDDDQYLLTVPRDTGHTPTSDQAYPDDSHHTVAVYGRNDLERRLAEARERGVEVAWQPLDDADEA